MSDTQMMEVQRSLGRIEAMLATQQDEFRRGLKEVKEEFASHKQDDQKAFSSIRVALGVQRDERESHLNDQDTKLGLLAIANTRLQVQDENTKTIGKWIIGAFGSLFLLLGSAAVAAFSGHIKIIP
jgi:hypothetical protein